MSFAAKYDVAISTACAGLDYIVVETTSAAQACVELLRKGNLGVATFMILVLHTTFCLYALDLTRVAIFIKNANLKQKNRYTGIFRSVILGWS